MALFHNEGSTAAAAKAPATASRSQSGFAFSLWTLCERRVASPVKLFSMFWRGSRGAQTSTTDDGHLRLAMEHNASADPPWDSVRSSAAEDFLAFLII